LATLAASANSPTPALEGASPPAKTVTLTERTLQAGAKRQKSLCDVVIEISSRAQQRLDMRYSSVRARLKLHNLIVVALAR